MREVSLPPKKIVIGQPVNPEKAARAKEFRSNMTYPEKLLWEKLRANRLNSHHFRRQQVIGGYNVDFYCHQAGLVIEIDGASHADQVDYDLHRDQVLATFSVRVLRISSQDVIKRMDYVISTILEAFE